MSASLKIKVDPIRNFAQRCQDPSIRQSIMNIPREKAVEGLIAQSIHDNFDQEGPGWPPRKIQDAGGGGKVLQGPNRTLMRSVTTPGAPGNIHRVEGTTITWGTNLIYAGIHQRGGVITVKKAKFLFIPISKKGASVGPTKGRDAQKKSGLKFGRDMVFKKSVRIPARPYLVIRDVWKRRIFEYAIDRAKEFIKGRLAR